jgi:2-methylcitrate dehydratase PrpD
VGLPTNAKSVVDNRAMHNICLQDTLSAFLVRGSVHLIESPFPQVLAEPAFQRLRPRVTLRADADLDRELPEGRAAIVRITLRDGTSYTERVDWPRGHSRRGGASWDDLAAKWHQGLPDRNVDRLIEMARGLENLEDVRELVTAFEPQT